MAIRSEWSEAKKSNPNETQKINMSFPYRDYYSFYVGKLFVFGHDEYEHLVRTVDLVHNPEQGPFCPKYFYKCEIMEYNINNGEGFDSLKALNLQKHLDMDYNGFFTKPCTQVDGGYWFKHFSQWNKKRLETLKELEKPIDPASYFNKMLDERINSAIMQQMNSAA